MSLEISKGKICRRKPMYLKIREFMCCLLSRASSISRHADFHAKEWNSWLPWTLSLAAEKCGIAHFFAAFISNSRFFGLLFNFTIYKTIKASHCEITFVIIMSIMT